MLQYNKIFTSVATFIKVLLQSLDMTEIAAISKLAKVSVRRKMTKLLS